MHDWDTDEYRQLMRAEYERIRAKHPALVTTGFSCFVGWFPILERFFDTVAAALAEAPGVEFDLWQVKEKFGGLRIYFVVTMPKPRLTLDSQAVRDDEARRRISAAYERAEHEAKVTCDVCGRPGVLRSRSGWFATRCEEHADGGVPYQREGDDE
jgi:hypothetical protein